MRILTIAFSLQSLPVLSGLAPRACDLTVVAKEPRAPNTIHLSGAQGT